MAGRSPTASANATVQIRRCYERVLQRDANLETGTLARPIRIVVLRRPPPSIASEPGTNRFDNVFARRLLVAFSAISQGRPGRLAETLAGGLLGGFDRAVASRGLGRAALSGRSLDRFRDDGSDTLEKRPFARPRELLDGLVERQPLHRLYVACRAAC